MRCTRCAGERFAKAERDRKSRQLYRCTRCGRRLSEGSGSAFWGYRFPEEVIALAVRWYFASARIATRASVRLPGPLPRRTGAKRPLPICVERLSEKGASDAVSVDLAGIRRPKWV